ncbi:recombination and repair protein [Gallibacterium salpingitidis]|uniref:DNA repair protein RecN n=2 Tax=Gallibacterium salpingitidis TaxID=505341 RepID=A0AB36E1A0_9PAST|nr:DNA repair protein RecN [Gallibacterium salpingitidis]OBX09085.1 recombination and repair protein [Gallibacterium salpingitidis]OBX09652.1 recombination and repair protein [Gallibacterium salpingitidis]WKT00813.1 DNA repair protein RecN [Gallibacterium salpingitidis]
MLTQLQINNFAIVNHLTLDFANGMSVITGETGAGKSIALDALAVCLGQRVDANMLRSGESRADVSAVFSLQHNAIAQQWLKDHELDDEDNPDECILRRIITQEGRSKGFINNQPVPAAQLRELGDLLVQISGQHSSQLLLKPDYQLHLLDTFCHNRNLLQQLAEQYRHWKQQQHNLADFRQQCAENEARKQLLHYQIAELNEFALKHGEFEELDQTQKRLASSDLLTRGSQSVLQLLAENETANIDNLLNKAAHYVDELVEADEQFSNAQQLIQQAQIYIQEAISEVQHLAYRIEDDPELLADTEMRIKQALQLAKKHRIAVEELPSYHQQLIQEYQQLAEYIDGEDQLIALEQQAYQAVVSISQQLSERRQQGAILLAKEVTEQIKQLAMENAEFDIQCVANEEKLSANGLDQITFMLMSNLGENAQPLHKNASGGELSRIALVLQTLTSDKSAVPTVIFDEIDVGISGAIANIVGKLLRSLGQSVQILCITHLPQVASQGHHHYKVEKYCKEGKTETTVMLLNTAERVNELGRLLGGSQVTQLSLANAEEMLALAG